jgi:hypothetical protein
MNKNLPQVLHGSLFKWFKRDDTVLTLGISIKESIKRKYSPSAKKDALFRAEE